MMSRCFFTVLLLSVCCSTALAKSITAEQALLCAQNFVSFNGGHRAPAKNDLSLAYQAEGRYYVFNRSSDNGFVIVSGDDRTLPILGYSESGAFDLESIPDNMRWWLTQYQKEIDYLQSDLNVPIRQAAQLNHSVTPMVTCVWDQDEPYNNMCPTYTSNGTTKRALTGCVATAMAQIMYYHRWPVQGTGSHYYDYEVGGGPTQRLSADFSQSFYDWEHMLDDYNAHSDQVSQDAVAKLMSDVGISVEMEYNDGGSGAPVYKVRDALKDYFSYDQTTHRVNRRDFGISGWELMLRNELDNNRPVFYAGYSEDGAHAFVLDGYNTDGYFHVNWGWGGSGDGYFLISMLNPGIEGIGSFEGGFNSYQEAIIGIQPQREQVDPYSFEARYNSIKAKESSVALGDTASFVIEPVILSGSKEWETLYLGLCVMDEDEKTMIQEPYYDTDATDFRISVITAKQTKTMQFVPRIDLSDGIYHVRPVVQANGESFRYIMPSTKAPAFVEMRVEDGIAYFSTSTETNLQLLNMATNSATLYTDKLFEIIADVKNYGLEYYDNVYFAWLQNGQQKAKSFNIPLDLAQGSTFTIRMYMTAPSSAGQYQLMMCKADNSRMGDALNLTVVQSGISVLEQASDIQPAADTMPADNIQATVYVRNTGDPFMGFLEMFLLTADTCEISIPKSDIVTIGTDETKPVRFNFSFGGDVGMKCLLWMRDPNISNGYCLWGEPVMFTVGEYQSQWAKGDVNHDGIVDIVDINAMINIILRNMSQTEDSDLNGDGMTDIADINAVINEILGDHQ